MAKEEPKRSNSEKEADREWSDREIMEGWLDGLVSSRERIERERAREQE